MISYYLKDFGNLTINGQLITGLEADTTYNIVVTLTNNANLQRIFMYRHRYGSGLSCKLNSVKSCLVLKRRSNVLTNF